MSKKPTCCSFCYKSNLEVAQLIANGEVAICNECVQLCVELILGARSEPATANYPCGSLGEEVES